MFITKTELKLYFNSKLLFIVMLFAIVSITISLLGNKILYGNKIFDDFSIAIVNNDTSRESNLMVSMISSFGIEGMNVFECEEEETADILKDGNTAAVIIFPKDFFSDIMSGVNTPAEVITSKNYPLIGEVIKMLAQSATEDLSGVQAGIYASLDVISDEERSSYVTDVNMKFLAIFLARNIVSEQISATGVLSPNVYYLVSVTIFLMFLCSAVFIQSGNVLNKTEILNKLSISKTSIYKLCFFKMLSLYIVYLVLSCFFLLIFGILSQFNAEYFNIYILPFVLFCPMLFALFALLISSLFSSSKVGGPSVFLIQLLFLFLSGGIIPLIFLPKSFETAALFTINYNMIEIIRSAFTKTININCYLILIVMAVVMFFLSCLVLNARKKYTNRSVE